LAAHALSGLASEGAKVVITDIEDHTGQETAAAFRAKGYTANFIQQDVTSEGQWQSVLADIDRLHARLDILVNNAGIAIRKSIFEMTMDEYQLQNSINLDGVFLGLKYGIPMIAKTEGGSVINLSSVAGLKASPGLSAYAMTKGGVRLLSKSVAKECIAEGINGAR
jgi:NAD(P)-dependent dehydrogenase (short-subunit alcohol dehydrogenase family)